MTALLASESRAVVLKKDNERLRYPVLHQLRN